MIIYYAHCIAIYGTTQERRDLATLRDIFPHDVVVNPNTSEIANECNLIREAYNHTPLNVDVPGYPGGTYATESEAVMDRIFKPLVHACDVLAFRGLPDGAIPAGVAREIEWAQQYYKGIIELPSGFTRRTLTLEQTREYLKEIGSR